MRLLPVLRHLVPQVHDMFNFLTVMLLLPLEAASGYLRHFSGALMPDGLTSGNKPPDMLNKLTTPFTKALISVDKKLISQIAAADTPEELEALEGKVMLKKFFGCEPKDGCGLSDAAAGVISGAKWSGIRAARGHSPGSAGARTAARPCTAPAPAPG